MTELTDTSQSIPEVFDERWYLSQYPDVAAAVERGATSSGLEHWIRHGKWEGRQPFEFDERWYVQSYPFVKRELERGLTKTVRSHYEEIGRHRGYLPHASAVRPEDPVIHFSRFGGLWIDRSDAKDRVRGKCDAGLITVPQAEQLVKFISDGFVIIEGAVDEGAIEEARRDLDRAYLGLIRHLQFECRTLRPSNGPWHPRMNESPSKALDIHWFSPAIRSLIFSSKIVSFLKLIFDSKPLATQTLGFLRGSQQELHQDSAYVSYTLQRNFAASWIALEDVAEGAGELRYFLGSHRIPEFLYGGRYKSAAEFSHAGASADEIRQDVNRHISGLRQNVGTLGLQEQRFLAKSGDALIWHADLVHAGSEITSSGTRKSVVTHYSPAAIAPLYFEGRDFSIHDSDGSGYFSSSYYSDSQRR